MYSELFEIILAVEQTKSFNRAAKLLHMSQPAISNKVQAMESYYGVQIFHRTSNGVKLTEAGRIMFSYALKFEQLNKMMHVDINSLLNPADLHIEIGTSCIAGKLLPYIVGAYKKKYPQINININISNPSKQLKELKNSTYDFLMISDIFDLSSHDEYKYHVIGYHDFVIIAPNSGGWKNKHSISLGDLLKYPLVVREQGATARVIMEKILLSHGYLLKDVKIGGEMNSIYAIKEAVQSGLGLALVPKMLVLKELEDRTVKTVKAIELEDEHLRIPFCIIYLKNNDIKNHAKSFVDFVIKNRNRICDETGTFV